MNLSAVRKLAKTFGNTITSTLWRAVEHLDVPAFAMISTHPHHPGDDFDAANPCRYFIQSNAFKDNFGHLSEVMLFGILCQYCRYTTRGPHGESEEVILDDNGQEHIFHFESFSNSYEVLTLAIYSSQRKIIVARC